MERSVDTGIVLPSYDLKGKIAIVTGAGRGIGFEVARTLAAAGASVVVSDLRQEACDEAAQRLEAGGQSSAGFAADVSSSESVRDMLRRTVEAYGRVDILVNNAGVTIPEKPIFDVTEKEWNFVHGVDLKGLYFTSQIVAAQMRGQSSGGRIVNLASAAGIMTPKYASVYGAAKAGVVHLTKIMAKEWARYNIGVNAVAPGYIETDMIKGMLENEKNADFVMKSIPMRRFGEASDVARVVLFLVTEASTYLTGVVIPVDGGMQA
jgi:NAD(P)-dependent dehydrogenase (short-subunit alcohol dehydrogenase family)